MQTTTDKMKKELSMKEILAQYIKHKNGTIFQMLDHKNEHLVWLRIRNKYRAKTRKEILQGLIDGNWISINEHEWRKWVKKDNEYMQKFTQKLVKRTILTQLLIENDDSLIEDMSDEPQFKKLLIRSTKEGERIALKNFDRLYDADKTVLQNLMNNIDDMTTKMSELEIGEFMHLNNVVQAYLDNQESFKDQPITLQEVE